MKRIVLILTFLVLGCGTKTADSTQSDALDSASLTVTADSVENFEVFFQRFRNDSSFQITRVKFPWTLMTWEPGTDAPAKQLVDKQVWKHLRFYYEAGYATRQLDAYTQQVKSYGDTVKLELRGVDNGIMTDYEFTMDNRKWFLVSEKDYSN